MRLTAKSTFLALSLMSASLAALSAATPAAAQGVADGPYISRAMDAVLLPLTDAVKKEFNIDSRVSGLLVVAVQPGGIADGQRLEPGDVIVSLEGYRLKEPFEVDTITGYWLNKGKTELDFQYLRAGQVFRAPAMVSVESFGEATEIESVRSWESVSVENFSYESFYSKYSDEMISNYSESTQQIETYSSSEEYGAELEAAESNEEEIIQFDEPADAGAEEVVDDGGDAGGEEEVVE